MTKDKPPNSLLPLIPTPPPFSSPAEIMAIKGRRAKRRREPGFGNFLLLEREETLLSTFLSFCLSFSLALSLS